MHSDYIERMIEQFIKVLLGIVRSRKEEDYEEAVAMIQEAGKRFLGMDIGTLLQDDPKSLLGRFDKPQGFDIDRCIICADLLYELALISQAQNYVEEARHLKILCLNLYCRAIPKDKRFQDQEYRSKLKGLIEDLKGQPLPIEVQNNLNIYKTIDQ